MEDRSYRRLIGIVTVLGAAVTLAHLAYIIYAYRHCSIICFIAGELW